MSHLKKWLPPAIFFAVSAAVVVWQNSRIAVLMDIAYVLEHAWRISAGDIPYRDFPLPHAPGTFLIQSLLISLFDGSYAVHIAYAAVVSGLAAVLAVELIEEQLTGFPRWAVLLFCAPLLVLSVYGVYPHPFYDPDACFLVLLGFWLVLQARRRSWPPLWCFAAGVVLALTPFFKQNIGFAFGFFSQLWLLTLLFEKHRKAWLTMFAGSVTALTFALLQIHWACGLDNYYDWTITWATARRMPVFTDLLEPFFHPYHHAWVVPTVLGAVLWRATGVLRWLGLGLMLIPALAVSLGDQATFLLVWAFAGTCGALITVASLVRKARPDFVESMFLVALLTAMASFASQGIHGSSYGVWPLLIISLAGAVRLLAKVRPAMEGALAIYGAVLGLGLLSAGAQYVWRMDRLQYVKHDGPVQTSTWPRLRGLATEGTWVPELDQLLVWIDQNIPPEEALISLPGEDPLFFALRRPPQFPVLLFEASTVNPMSIAQMREQLVAKKIQWLVVKDPLQTTFTGLQKHLGAELTTPDFTRVKQLGRYQIFRRTQPPPP